jgi:hypothetical protein
MCQLALVVVRGVPADQALQQDYAQRKNIGSTGQRLFSASLLRRKVAGGAERLARGRTIVLLQVPGGAEVDECSASRIFQDDVRGLDIAVDNALRPDCLDRRRNVAPYRQHLGLQHPSGFQPFAQRLAFDEFPRNV